MDRRLWMKLLTSSLALPSASRAAGAIRLSPNSRGTHEISWAGGSLELNLVPMSQAAAATANQKVAYTKMREDASLYLPIADLVGLTAMRLHRCPAVPRILWDNREHHYWQGFEGSFEPRNVVVNEPKAEKVGDAMVRASCYYIANHVKTTMTWEFTPPAQKAWRANWTTIIEVENRTTEPLRNYVQFFACYHKPGTNYYWDASRKITACGDGSFMATRDEAAGAMIRSSPEGTHMKRYLGDHTDQFRVYHRPVLLSGKEESFGGLRHVTMSEPVTCGGICTWMQQARDYQITPPNGELAPGAKFRARIRHVIAPAESPEDLEALWQDFETKVLTG